MPNPSELQREEDGLSPVERRLGEYECRSPATYGSIIGQDVEGLLAENAILRERIKELELDLERLREREMLTERAEMNRRIDERIRSEPCKYCGYPPHPLNWHEPARDGQPSDCELARRARMLSNEPRHSE